MLPSGTLFARPRNGPVVVSLDASSLDVSSTHVTAMYTAYNSTASYTHIQTPAHTHIVSLHVKILLLD